MPPNVLLVVADDLGCGDLGIAGNGVAVTPSIDACAREGVSLAQHYSGGPVCSPGRAALITGRYPQRTGVIDTREVRGLSRLSRREITLANRLQRGGYATGLVGKWHLGSVGEAYAPHHRGFDEWVGLPGGASDYWDYDLLRNGRPDHGDGTYLTDRLTSEAIAFLRRHQHEPFLLEVAYNAPHVPLQAPAEAVGRFADLGLSHEVATLNAMNMVMDAGIGRIVECLEDLRLLDDTILIITSDHGPDLSGTPQFSETPDPARVRYNCGLRGSKGLVFDGGIRVPAYVRWPGGGLAAGRLVTQPTHHIDWVPTILELVAAPAASLPAADEPSLDGASVAAALAGGEINGDRPLAWQWNRYSPIPRCNAALRRGKWKLVWPARHGSLYALPEDSAADRELDRPGSPHELQPYSEHVDREVPPEGAPLLFDLEIDPGESTDLAAEHPELVQRMTAELDDWFADVETERAQVVAAGWCD